MKRIQVVVNIPLQYDVEDESEIVHRLWDDGYQNLEYEITEVQTVNSLPIDNPNDQT